ncbi:MAG: glycosyltransferase family 2 protein [Syntrophaceae bacterium]|nr:glycosyltransferase family 2 protein [Syntrophaceae bacterium]
MVPLSIIIVNWNTKEYLFLCLESIFKKESGKSQEVIVIDNGSQDGSGIEIKQKFPFIHLIENKKNLGFAKAANQGLRKASGHYLLLLNPDTEIKNGAIGRLVAFLNSHPEVGVAGGQLLNSDGSRQNSIASYPSLATELLNKNLLRWLFPERFPGKERKYAEPIEVDSVIGACLMVRREVLNQVGLLDEDYFLFLEETDWCYRMKKSGWKIYHVPQAEVIHFQGKSAEREIARAKVEYYRSRYLFFKKHRGFFQWVLLAIGLNIKLWVEFVSMSVACLLTLFTIKRWRRKLSVYATLLKWHLKFCPAEMGLRAIS